MLANRKFKATLIATLVIAGCCLLFDFGLKTALGVLLVGSAITCGVGIRVAPTNGQKVGPDRRGKATVPFDPPPVEGGSYCSSCGTYNTLGARFCRKCGLSIEDVDVKIQPEPAADAPDHVPQSPDEQSKGHFSEVQDSTPESIEHTTSDGIMSRGEYPPPLYAGLFARFLAYVCDLAVIYLLVFGIAFFIGFSKSLGMIQSTISDDDYQLLFFPVLWIYMTVSLIATRTTIGKYILGLEIANANDFRPKSRPSVARIVLRETVGRIVSSLFLGFGYWGASDNPKRQAWSDQMGRSIVRRRIVNPAVRAVWVVFVVAVVFSGIALFSWSEEIQRRQKLHQEWTAKLEASSKRVTVARDAVSRLMAENSEDFDKLHENMRRALGSLDAYEREMDEYQELFRTGLRNNLTMSEGERSQIRTLIDVMDLRKQQAEVERIEANAILAFDPTSSDVQVLKATLQPLDKQVEGIDKTASDRLARAGIQ